MSVIAPCHFNGVVREASQNFFNFNYVKRYTNSGYAGHIVIKAILSIPVKKEPRVVAKSLEKFIHFIIY